MAAADKPEIVHATCVSHHGRGILIFGASGTGKSSLALQLMSLGARLVSDDRTVLVRRGADVIADAPEAIRGMIEARGVGLIRVEGAQPAPVRLIVDLDQTEAARLPELHSRTVAGQEFPCLYHAPSPHFAAAILHYAIGGIGLRT